MNTSTERPRFRSDLVAQPLDQDGQLFIDVTDPDSGKTFRFYDVEYALACAMDGERDVNGLASWAHQELGLETSAAELETVITTLSDLGYLAAAGDTAAQVSEAYDSVRGGDVDLGRAGGAPGAPEPPAMPKAPDLDLGFAGTSEAPPQRPAPSAAEDVRLGGAGAGAAESPEAMPKAPSLDLGRAGSSAAAPPEESFAGLMDEDGAAAAGPPAARSDFDVPPTPPPAEVPLAQMRPRSQADADDDGPTNLPPAMPDFDDEEVSVDLSEHLSIGTDDLKEAVRASQTMKAVDVPPELAAELEDEPPPAEAPQAASAPLPEPAAPQAHAPPMGSRPIEIPAGRPPVSTTKPALPVEPSAGPAAEGERRKGVSPVLLVLFVIVLIGAAAAYYFLIYLPEQDANPSTSGAAADENGETGETDETDETDEPPAPELVAVPLTQGEPAAKPVPSTLEGRVVWTVEDGVDVAQGDPVLRVTGFEAWEQRKANDESDARRYRKRIADHLPQIEELRANGKEKAAERMAKYVQEHGYDKLAAREETIAEAEKEIAKYTMTAPAAGKVSLQVKAGHQAEVGEVAFTIEGAPQLVASFPIPKGGVYKADQEIEITAADDSQASETCQVTAVENDEVSVVCPGSGAFAPGDEVVLPAPK